MTIYRVPTLEQLIGLLNLAVKDITISRQGLHNRISKNAVTFFEFMINKAIDISIPIFYDINLLQQFNQVLIVDSTSFQLPEELADVFTGCGGSGSEAGIKIQFGYDLKNSKFFYLFQNGKTPDNHAKNSFIDKVEANDIIIRDLGYFVINTFNEIDKKNAYFLSRLKSDIKVYKKDDNNELIELDLVEYIKDMKVDIVELEDVYLNVKGIIIKTRLILEKAPKEILQKRLRKINRNNKKKVLQLHKEQNACKVYLCIYQTPLQKSYQ